MVTKILKIALLTLVLVLASCAGLQSKPEQKKCETEDMVLRHEMDHKYIQIFWVDEDCNGSCDYAVVLVPVGVDENGDLVYDVAGAVPCDVATEAWAAYEYSQRYEDERAL